MSKKIALKLILFLAFFSVNAQGLKTNGQNIVDENNNIVQLRGIGLSGWMLQECYLLNACADGITTQNDIKKNLTSLVGQIATDSFYNDWLDNYITEDDIIYIAESGFNSIRVPLHYNLFTLPIEEEPLEGSNTWLTKGFELLDNLLNWCANHNIYVILDMHATPGGQGVNKEICDFDPEKPSLWESEFNKSKLVALWGKIAERYANNAWIGGYDLINETNWYSDGAYESARTFSDDVDLLYNSNNDLREIYGQITTAIRAHDQNHILFIEGNSFANNFNGLFPPWDANMVYSFHKYWNYTNASDLDWILWVRNQYNVPLWCGESGENSNVWYRDAVHLYENNSVGWSWWPFKKVESQAGPIATKSNENFKSIVNYWKGEGPQPSIENAIAGLNQLSQDLLYNEDDTHKDVIDALIRQPFDDSLIPFTSNEIPGNVYMSDYDLGTQGIAYYDNDYADYSLATGSFEAWNKGWTYRNDGVDIESNSDASTNGYHLAHTNNGEWVKHTVTVNQSGFYNIKIKFASLESGGKIKLELDDTDITGQVSLIGSSGNWNYFITKTVKNIYIEAGTQILKTSILGDITYNLSHLIFSLSENQSSEFKIIEAETGSDEQSIVVTTNQPIANETFDASEFTVYVNNSSATVTSVEKGTNTSTLILNLENLLTENDNITLDCISNSITSSFGVVLDDISNFPVFNTIIDRNDIPGIIEAENFETQSGLELENCSDTNGGQNIGYTSPGDYAEYNVRVNTKGIYNIKSRIASDGQYGKFSLVLIDANQNQTNLGNVNTIATGGWQNWFTLTSSNHTLYPGLYTLRLNVIDGGFNLNWMDFELEQELNTVNNELEALVAPNPFSDQIFIKTNSGISIQTISILDYNGRIIKNYNHIKSPNIYINTTEISKGVYFLKINTKNNYTYKRLIKR